MKSFFFEKLFFNEFFFWKVFLKNCFFYEIFGIFLKKSPKGKRFFNEIFGSFFRNNLMEFCFEKLFFNEIIRIFFLGKIIWDFFCWKTVFLWKWFFVRAPVFHLEIRFSVIFWNIFLKTYLCLQITYRKCLII